MRRRPQAQSSASCRTGFVAGSFELPIIIVNGLAAHALSLIFSNEPQNDPMPMIDRDLILRGDRNRTGPSDLSWVAGTPRTQILFPLPRRLYPQYIRQSGQKGRWLVGSPTYSPIWITVKLLRVAACQRAVESAAADVK
jgi:hypothetical protein